MAKDAVARPCYVSIDVGVKNIGVCFYSGGAETLVTAKLAPYGEGGAGEQDTKTMVPQRARLISRAVIDWVDEQLALEKGYPKLRCVIEKQVGTGGANLEAENVIVTALLGHPRLDHEWNKPGGGITMMLPTDKFSIVSQELHTAIMDKTESADTPQRENLQVLLGNGCQATNRRNPSLKGRGLTKAGRRRVMKMAACELAAWAAARPEDFTPASCRRGLATVAGGAFAFACGHECSTQPPQKKNKKSKPPRSRVAMTNADEADALLMALHAHMNYT